MDGVRSNGRERNGTEGKRVNNGRSQKHIIGTGRGLRYRGWVGNKGERGGSRVDGWE